MMPIAKEYEEKLKLNMEKGKIDWEQRRYEIAKETLAAYIMQPIVEGYEPYPKIEVLSEWAVEAADRLIWLLKNTKIENYEQPDICKGN